MSENKSLIQQTEDLKQILDQCDQIAESGDKIPAELEEALTNALTGHASKVDRCCSFVARAQAEIVWLKSEKDRIDVAIKKYQRAIDRMEDVAGMVMTAQKTRKLEGLKGHYFSKRVVRSVKISDVDLLPDDLKKTVVSVAPDKKLIGDKLKAGEKIPGAELTERDTILSK